VGIVEVSQGKYFWKLADTLAWWCVLAMKAKGNSLMRTNKELTDIYQRHKERIYRVCFAYMKNPSDTEDAVQDVFIRLMNTSVIFAGEEHEKAWLIRVATNVCKNVLRSWWRKRENLDDYENLTGKNNVEVDETLQVVMRLPDRHKAAVYLYYYEGYSSREIAEMLGKKQSTILNHLHEARGILREKLGGAFH